MESALNSPFIIPVSAFAMAAIIVALVTWGKARTKEIQVEHDLRVKKMEHEARMKELEIEKLKLGLKEQDGAGKDRP